MISVKETTQILGIGEHTLKRWVDEGRIKCIYVDEEMCFEEKEVNAFTEKTGIKLIKPKNNIEVLMTLMRELELIEIENKNIIKLRGSESNISKIVSYLSTENKTLSNEKIAELIKGLENN